MLYVAVGIALVVGIAIGFFGRSSPPRDPGAPPPPRPPPPGTDRATVDEMKRDAEVLADVDAGRKIDAIKRVRERTGLGLKESKDVVEAIAAERGR